MWWNSADQRKAMLDDLAAASASAKPVWTFLVTLQANNFLGNVRPQAMILSRLMRRPRRPNPRRALWIGVVAGVLGLAGYLGNTVSFTLLLGHPTLGILAATVLVLPLVLIGGPDPAVGVRPVLGGLWRRTWLSIALIALSWLTSQGLHLLLARLGLIPAGTSPGLAELAASRTGLLAVVVAAPFAEELLCRRLIYRHLRALYTRGSPWSSPR